MKGGFHELNLSFKLKDYYLIFFHSNSQNPWLGPFKSGLNINYFDLAFWLQKTLAIFSHILSKLTLK